MRTTQDQMAFYDFHTNINSKGPCAASAIAASCANVKIGGSAAPAAAAAAAQWICFFLVSSYRSVL